MAHDIELRAKVTALLLEGQGLSQIAKEYDIPLSTVSRWRSEAWREAGRSEDIGELLMAYLASGLETVRRQHEIFSDPGWLQGQDASGLAVLHGVLVDKLVRLLEALANSPVRGGYDA